MDFSSLVIRVQFQIALTRPQFAAGRNGQVMAALYGSRRARGFSVLELLVVVAVGLVVAALAMPNVMTAVANMRLRSATSNISGLVQDGRMNSVKRNRRTDILFSMQNNARVLYADFDLSGGFSSSDRAIQIPATINNTDPASGPGAIPDTTLGFTPDYSNSLPISFNSRGLPCRFASGTCTLASFVLYFNETRALGGGWAAVSISRAGRIKTWYWNGNSWAN